MKWRIKALIQNGIALLPDPLSYQAYYRMQRLIGGLRKVDHVDVLNAAVKVFSLIRVAGGNPVGGRFLEVGTGRVPLVPVAYWLMGARSTITVDLNPYLREELLKEALMQLRDRKAEVVRLLGGFALQERLDLLLRLAGAPPPAEEIMELCRITYLAPCDASRLPLGSDAVDFHTSNNVLEHIPPVVLKQIMREAIRVVTPAGLSVHRIDYTDHFAHSDPTISQINFLRYTDATWRRIAGNRYMYMNRLRHDDLIELLQEAGQRILAVEPVLSDEIAVLLRRGVRLDGRFSGKTPEVLATTSAWVISRGAE